MYDSELKASEDALNGESTRPLDKPKIGKNRRRRSVIALLAGVVVIASMQWLAPNFDHQIVNILSFTIGMTVACYVVLQALLASVAAGHPMRVPCGVAALVIGFFVLFQPDGFSGEMWPQFRFRFGARREVKGVEGTPTAVAANADAIRALADSPQFLGPNRNGVIAERKFSVPTMPAEVEVLWDQGIGQGWSSFAVAGDRAVTLEQRKDLECVTCYRLADGELLWMHSHPAYHYHPLGGAGPRSTPTIVGDKVFTQGATGHVCCLQLESGEPIWEVDLLELAGWTQAESETAIAWGRATSPLIVDQLCVVPYGTPVDVNDPESGERSLMALDSKTGDVRWKAGSDQISYASPIVMTLAGQRQIVSVNEKTVTGHRIDDGKVLWSFDWPGASNSNATCTMAVPAGKDRFLIGKGYGGGSALVELTKNAEDEFAANRVWQSFRVLKTKFTHACVAGDVAYALSDGSLQAVTVDDGARLWMQPRTARCGQGQILLVDDVIVAQSEAGEVVLLSADPKEYKELVRLPALTAKTWNIPAVAGRHLLVRNDRQVICFLLPKK